MILAAQEESPHHVPTKKERAGKTADPAVVSHAGGRRPTMGLAYFQKGGGSASSRRKAFAGEFDSTQGGK